MKREELGAGLVGAAVGTLIVAAIVAWTPQLASSGYANAASNLLGILAGPSLIAAVAVALWRRWHDRCAVPRCVRLGEHPVDACLAKVCAVHHNEESHELVYALRHVAGAFGWGDSHRLTDRQEES